VGLSSVLELVLRLRGIGDLRVLRWLLGRVLGRAEDSQWGIESLSLSAGQHPTFGRLGSDVKAL